MPAKHEAMTAKEYRDWLKESGLTAYAAAKIIGVSLSQSYRYESGEQPIPAVIAKLIDMLKRHGIPRDWR